MRFDFDHVTNLQYKVKSLTLQLEDFRSGEKYAAMRTEFDKRLAHEKSVIRGLKSDLADSRAETVTARKNWGQVFEDVSKEHAGELRKKDREIDRLEKLLLETQRQLDASKDRLRDKNIELYRVKTELEEEKGKNLKLTAQINRDHENSSIPSSLKPNRRKITNNREKTGRKPGGQPGHAGHGRKRREPACRVDIPAPEKYASGPDYKPTGKTVTRQMVDISVNVTVVEYATPEFVHIRTGKLVHAEFPEGAVNDVNYSGGVKALAYLLNNYCNVSVGKVSGFLSELTGGELKLSTGMINGLSGEFARKAEAGRKKAFADMLLSPVMNLDFTAARVNGKNMNVLVCATPETALYFAREHKGHKGIKGSPAEDYQGIMVHDHDMTFYNYGRAHQECLEHVLRYLRDSMDNEADLKWNRRMRELIREAIHFRNSLDPGDGRDPDRIDPEKVAGFEAEYDEILDLAKEEYEYEPPSKYYMNGFNLYKRLLKYRDNHLLFLHDGRVPHTNNLSERLLRVFKRKQSQVMAFRSFEGLDYLCRSLGSVASARANGENLYAGITSIFNTPINGGEIITY